MEMSDKGRWIVDEVIIDPHYPNSLVVLDRGNYYLVRTAKAAVAPTPLPHYQAVSAYRRFSHNFEWVTFGLQPRVGFFTIEVGRAITPSEWDELIKRENLGKDDMTEEFGATIGEIYGPSVAQRYKVRQILVDGSHALDVESRLRDMGIEAFNGSPGRVTIRVA
jgi:hypothetical protein